MCKIRVFILLIIFFGGFTLPLQAPISSDVDGARILSETKKDTITQKEHSPKEINGKVLVKSKKKLPPKRYSSKKLKSTFLPNLLILFIIIFVALLSIYFFLKKKTKKALKIIRQKRDGFSLIEAIIAISFVTLAFFSIMSLMVGNMRAGSQIEGLHKAIQLTTQKIEEVKLQPFPDITSEDEGEIEDNYYRTVTVVESGTSLKEITVTVSWNNTTGSPSNYSLFTIVNDL